MLPTDRCETTVDHPVSFGRQSWLLSRLAHVAIAGSLGMLALLVMTVHLTSASSASDTRRDASIQSRDDSLSKTQGGFESDPSDRAVGHTVIVSGPDIVVAGLHVVSTSAQQATIVVTVTNQGISATVGPDNTGWFGTDLYVKPVGDPPPSGPGDRYLGACPTPTNYCPWDIRWDLYRITKYSEGEGLAPGESWVLTYTYPLSAGTEYWLYVQADTFWGERGDPDLLFGSSLHGRIVEDDEANNIFGPALVDLTIKRVFLPLAMHDYDATLPPFAIQMYGGISASNGFTRVVESGARWVRLPVLWSSIEPFNTTPENYNWAAVDASVQTATSSDVHLILTIDYNPSWAAAQQSGPVYNPADLQELVGALVARYPQVEYWEFYNEPDGLNRFANNGAGYAAMLQSVYPVVKAANSNAKVVMGGLAMDWFTEDGGPFDSGFLVDVLSNCAGVCFDVANFHYYPAFRHVWEAYGHDIIGKATYMRQVLAAHGFDRPLINTEAGWPAGSVWGSPELQARYVTKVYVRGFAAGLPLTNWYALTDADSSSPGLLAPGLTPRPAFMAYQTLTSLMSRARFVRAISSTVTGSAQIEGYEFSVPGSGSRKRLDVYWYDCPSMYVVGLPSDCGEVAPLDIGASQIAVIDKLGVRLILNDADDGLLDGRIALPGGVGSSPIYIDYQP